MSLPLRNNVPAEPGAERPRFVGMEHEALVLDEHKAKLDRIIAENAKPVTPDRSAIERLADFQTAESAKLYLLEKRVEEDEEALELDRYGLDVQAKKIATLEQENATLTLSNHNLWLCLRAIAKACRQAGIVIPNPETATRLPSC